METLSLLQRLLCLCGSYGIMREPVDEKIQQCGIPSVSKCGCRINEYLEGVDRVFLGSSAAAVWMHFVSLFGVLHIVSHSRKNSPCGGLFLLVLIKSTSLQSHGWKNSSCGGLYLSVLIKSTSLHSLSLPLFYGELWLVRNADGHDAF